MNTKEGKLAEQIANVTEDHYFNPAAVGRILAEQPFYTTDRIMELVLWIIEKQARRHDIENAGGQSSESLWLASELDKYVDKMKKKYVFDNIRIP